jgi:hypothetical protein
MTTKLLTTPKKKKKDSPKVFKQNLKPINLSLMKNSKDFSLLQT